MVIIGQWLSHFAAQVNNAGAITFVKICEASMDHFISTMDLNVTAQVSMTKLALPHLLRSKGKLTLYES